MTLDRDRQGSRSSNVIAANNQTALSVAGRGGRRFLVDLIDWECAAAVQGRLACQDFRIGVGSGR